GDTVPVRDDGDMRACRHVMIQLADDGLAAAVPAEDESPLKLGFGSLSTGQDQVLVQWDAEEYGEMDLRVIFGSRYDLVIRLDARVHGRVHFHRAVRFADAHQRGCFKCQQRLAISFPGKVGFLRKIDLVALEVHQLGVDNGESALARGLRYNTRDDVG